jgi:Family of unknown function (DUF6152)
MRFESGPVVSMIVVAMTFGVAIALPVGAHHTPPPGLFNDMFSDVQGVVKEVRLRPPHAWIMLEVKGDDGVLQLWPLEAASPIALQGIGVTPDYVKAGDTIKARCRRLRVVPKGHDNDCILGFLKARDGTVKDWSGKNAAVPTDF